MILSERVDLIYMDEIDVDGMNKTSPHPSVPLGCHILSSDNHTNVYFPFSRPGTCKTERCLAVIQSSQRGLGGRNS